MWQIYDAEGSENSATVIVKREDHTLGRILQWMLARKYGLIIYPSPEVEFGACSIPTPYIDAINFRIQTYGTVMLVLMLQAILRCVKRWKAHCWI